MAWPLARPFSIFCFKHAHNNSHFVTTNEDYVPAEIMDEIPKCAVGLFLQQNFLDKIKWICDTWSTTITDVKS